MSDRGIRWTPKEIEAFGQGLIEVKRVYPEVLKLLEEFLADNQHFKIQNYEPNSPQGVVRWPHFFAYVPLYTDSRSESNVEAFGDKTKTDVPRITVHPLKADELTQLSALTSKISNIGLQVKPWKVFTDDRQIAAMRYTMTPYYKKERGLIVASYLRPPGLK